MLRKLVDNKVINVNIWRYLVNFWAFVLYTVILADFWMGNTLVYILGPISAIYIALLAVYSAQKEFERWHDYYIGWHPGEMYVIIWTSLILFLYILEFSTKATYVVPSEVFTTYIVVIGVLAITKRSKRKYREKKKK